MKKILFSLLAVALVAGCGKDRDADEYQQEKTRRDLAKLQAVEGRYSGLLISKQSTKPFGAFQVILKAKTATNPQTGETKTVLTATVQFQSTFFVDMMVQDAFYDTETGHLEFNISASSNGPTFNLDGVVQGSSLAGIFEVLGYTEYGSTISLVKDGKTLAQLVAENKSDFPPVLSDVQSYYGTGWFEPEGKAGKASPMKLTVTNRYSNRALELAYLMAPTAERYLSVTYTFTDTEVSQTLQTVRWAKTNGVLDGTQDFNYNGRIITVTLTCLNFYFTPANQPYNFSCEYLNTGRDVRAPLEFKKK